MRNSVSLTRPAAVAVSLIMILFSFTPAVFADSLPSVTITASASAVHSGAPVTLTAALSSPAPSDIVVEVARGETTYSVAVAAGQSSGSVEANAGTYEKGGTDTFSVVSGGGYSAGEPAQVSVEVLPVPQLSFKGTFYLVSAGRNLQVTVTCENYKKMSVPLPTTLKSSDGTVFGNFTFDRNNDKKTFEFTVPTDWEYPYALYLYNDTNGTVAASVPVGVIDSSRPSVRKVDRKGKIAISFDCGFENKFTQYILDTLDEYDAKATFFVTGHFVKGFPDMLKQIHEKGHEIGNHTMSHPRLNKMSSSDVYKEIKGVNDGVEKVVGVKPTVMRPPYGAGSSEVAAVSRMLGCEVIYWTIDTLDWDPNQTAETIIDRATNGMGEGCIILFHNSAPKTEETLRTILDDYKAKGLEIVPVSEVIYASHYVVDEDGLQSLDPAYTLVSGADMLHDFYPTVNVAGTLEDGSSTVKLELEPVFSDSEEYRKKTDADAIAADPSVLEIKMDCGDTIQAPVRAGDSIGTAEFLYNNEVWFTAELKALSDMPAYAPPAQVEPVVTEISESRFSFGGEHKNELIINGASLFLLAAAVGLAVAKKRKAKN